MANRHAFVRTRHRRESLGPAVPLGRGTDCLTAICEANKMWNLRKTSARKKKDGILVVHNSYQQEGGEDRVFQVESQLLRANGHRVFQYQDHNSRIGTISRLDLISGTIWNQRSYLDVADILKREEVDLVHLHNTFPLISPSVYYAARKAGVPIVQTLHNYRLLCPDAKLMRNGRSCEDCLTRKVAWPGVMRGCYQGSRGATAVTASMIAVHKLIGTWSKCIDQYVALTNFARAKFVQGGLPPEKIAVKPNFVDPDPGIGDGGSNYALFVGRLAPEKGISTLIAAWELVAARIPLRIVGDGPLSEQVRLATARNHNIQWLGTLSAREINDQLQGAKFLMCPSIWYESFGLVIVEAFSKGVPVIASDLGAMAELVVHNKTGLLFVPGDHEQCARMVNYILDRPDLLAYMRSQARREYEEHYTAARNYDTLMSIYSDAKIQHGDRARHSAERIQV